MLPLLLGADPAQATNVQLVSLAKAFAAGYGLVSSVAPAGEFGTEETYRNRIDSLFWALSERSEHEPDTAIRSRMVHAMYSLACETVFSVDLRKKNCCYRAADALVRDFVYKLFHNRMCCVHKISGFLCIIIRITHKNRTKNPVRITSQIGRAHV